MNILNKASQEILDDEEAHMQMISGWEWIVVMTMWSLISIGTSEASLSDLAVSCNEGHFNLHSVQSITLDCAKKTIY